MPDAQPGKGATIGSMIPTESAVTPSAVGVDIGCGMAARRLDPRPADLVEIEHELHGIPNDKGVERQRRR